MRAPVHDLHLSNLVSYASIAAGVAAIIVAAAGNRHGAAMCLALSALADTFDGKFARLFARTPRQAEAGQQLDSLVDACVFGLAPVGVMAALSPIPAGLAGLVWGLAASAYVIAVVTRLSFFNLAHDAAAFVGVPTPAIALLWATALLVPPTASMGVAMFVTCSALMVAPIPVPRPRGAGLVLFAAWAAVLVVVHLQLGT